jgi:recombination protein RecT
MANPVNQKPQTAIERAKDAQRTAMSELGALIASKREAFALVAGKHFSPDRLIKLAQGALARTPALAECTKPSILVALMRCAELGLEPDAALPQRRMWLIPRRNKKLNGAKECTYIIDYRAQLQLARDTGLVSSIIAEVVFQKDAFEYLLSPEGESITKFRFAPDPFSDDRGPIRGYLAAARLQGGEVHVVAMSHKAMVEHMRQHAPANQGSVTGPWEDFPIDPAKPGNPAMGIKTVLRKLFNLLPAGQNEAAMRLQAKVAEEAEVEAGKATTAAAVDLDLGAAEAVDAGGGTAEEVAAALTSGGPAKPPPDDIPFETTAEEKARKDREAAKGPGREPGQEG